MLYIHTVLQIAFIHLILDLFLWQYYRYISLFIIVQFFYRMDIPYLIYPVPS